MRKRHLVWFGLHLTSFTILALWSILIKPGINARNALRLHPGITEKEAEQVLGSPGIQCPGDAPDGLYVKCWERAGVKIIVKFSLDAQRMVVGGLHRKFSDHEEQVPLGQIPLGYELSFTEKILIWLGLPAL